MYANNNSSQTEESDEAQLRFVALAKKLKMANGGCEVATWARRQQGDQRAMARDRATLGYIKEALAFLLRTGLDHFSRVTGREEKGNLRPSSRRLQNDGSRTTGRNTCCMRTCPSTPFPPKEKARPVKCSHLTVAYHQMFLGCSLRVSIGPAGKRERW